jgi:hypothetical protein
MVSKTRAYMNAASFLLPPIAFENISYKGEKDTENIRAKMKIPKNALSVL